MDTLGNMRKALEYIEENLSHEIEHVQIARIALCSQYHFQRMFVFLTGIPLSEYIRRRRLTLAALDIQNTDEKIIDIALKYGYSSADAFSRAFQLMHHVTPSQARKKGVLLKVQPRIAVSLSLKGDVEMSYRIEEKEAFCITGMKERFSHVDNLGKSVGEMWGSVSKDMMARISALSNVKPEGIVGACSEMYDDNTTDYYIGAITTAECPADLVQLNVPAGTWAVFEITGALPAAMSEIWGRIFSEWFPATGYEHAQAPEIEWYSNGDMSSSGYKSEIWIPVRKNR